MPDPIFRKSNIGTLSFMRPFSGFEENLYCQAMDPYPLSAAGGKEKSMYFDPKEFGGRLQQMRKVRGMTQLELSERLGLASKQHISRMERGEKTCSIDLLIELSCVLNVSTDYLLMGKEPAKENMKNELLSVITQLTTIARDI